MILWRSWRHLLCLVLRWVMSGFSPPRAAAAEKAMPPVLVLPCAISLSKHSGSGFFAQRLAASVFDRGADPIDRVNITRAVVVFTSARPPDGLIRGRRSAVLSVIERIWHMGKNKDIREAVEAELTFDPLVADPRRQRRHGGHQGEHGDADRSRPYLARARRGRRCRMGGQRRLRRQRRAH